MGVPIELRVNAAGGSSNIQDATTKEIIFKTPGGSTVTKTADFVSGGGDGMLRYVSQAADFTEVGMWLAQVHLVFPGPVEVWSTVEQFEVQAKL